MCEIVFHDYNFEKYADSDGIDFLFSFEKVLKR